jgi:hypothetical protein
VRFASFPLLTEDDKAERSEGGLDPLGLVQASEALAVRLVPGVRERMSHPRYLTAMAAGVEVCGRFPEGTVARDGITPPGLVFEWLLVEGFTRTADGRDPFNLPGSMKGATARRQRVPLSAARYLKTASVFGFNGVYRGLARDLHIENANRLGETGYALLSVWAQEQKLAGFLGTGGGNGAELRDHLYSAVRESLEAGEVARSDSWRHWTFFREHLSPHQAGPREAGVLRDALLGGAGCRGQVLRFLVSDRGRKRFEKTQSERAFHLALLRSADPDLASLLRAISAYETFSRLCQDAFVDVLVEMTRRGGCKVTTRELGKLEGVKRASEKIPAVFGEVIERLEPFRETARFTQTFAPLAERMDPASWVDRLLGHHVNTQRHKPPAGKSPWLERFDDGSAIIRPLYRKEEPGSHDDSYVHGYRTRSLYSFAYDLNLFSA